MVGGLAYGYIHHNTLTALEHNKAEQMKIDNRDRLIAQAKAEWVKMNTPTGGKGVYFRNASFSVVIFAIIKTNDMFSCLFRCCH